MKVIKAEKKAKNVLKVIAEQTELKQKKVKVVFGTHVNSAYVEVKKTESASPPMSYASVM